MNKTLEELTSGKIDFILFTKPACVQCTATKRQFKKNGSKYAELNLQSDEGAMDLMRELNPDALQAPVVVTRNDTWSGFRPDKINLS